MPPTAVIPTSPATAPSEPKFPEATNGWNSHTKHGIADFVLARRKKKLNA